MGMWDYALIVLHTILSLARFCNFGVNNFQKQADFPYSWVWQIQAQKACLASTKEIAHTCSFFVKINDRKNLLVLLIYRLLFTRVAQEGYTFGVLDLAKRYCFPSCLNAVEVTSNHVHVSNIYLLCYSGLFWTRWSACVYRNMWWSVPWAQHGDQGNCVWSL